MPWSYRATSSLGIASHERVGAVPPVAVKDENSTASPWRQSIVTETKRAYSLAIWVLARSPVSPFPRASLSAARWCRQFPAWCGPYLPKEARLVTGAQTTGQGGQAPLPEPTPQHTRLGSPGTAIADAPGATNTVKTTRILSAVHTL